MSQWKKNAKALENRIEEVSLAVLIWGPGEDAVEFGKRKDIKKFINNKLENVEAKYSEEMLNSSSKAILDEIDQGLEHALTADMIIALNVSEGPMAEIIGMGHDFPEIAKKLYILMPEDYGGSFPFKYIDKNFLEERCYDYTQDEYNECILAKEICPKFVRKEKVRKLVNTQIRV